MTAELAVEAVKNACLNVRETRGIILHSDLGSQYTSRSFEKFLNSRGIRHSFSRKGNPYDNACIGSFHSVLKKEEISRGIRSLPVGIIAYANFNCKIHFLFRQL